MGMLNISQEGHTHSSGLQQVSPQPQNAAETEDSGLRPHPPAGPAAQSQDTGRNVNLQDFRGKLHWQLLSLRFVLQFLPNQLEEQADLFLCQGLQDRAMWQSLLNTLVLLTNHILHGEKSLFHSPKRLDA